MLGFDPNGTMCWALNFSQSWAGIPEDQGSPVYVGQQARGYLLFCCNVDPSKRCFIEDWKWGIDLLKEPELLSDSSSYFTVIGSLTDRPDLLDMAQSSSQLPDNLPLPVLGFLLRVCRVSSKENRGQL